MSHELSKAVEATAHRDKPLSTNTSTTTTNMTNKPPIAPKPRADKDNGRDHENKDNNTLNKPALPGRPVIMGPNKTKPPVVKRKPLSKSKSVDLTQMGGSEWKDFCDRRRQEVEESDPEEVGRFATVRGLTEHRNNSIVEQTIREDQVLQIQELVENQRSKESATFDTCSNDENTEVPDEKVAKDGIETSHLLSNDPSSCTPQQDRVRELVVPPTTSTESPTTSTTSPTTSTAPPTTSITSPTTSITSPTTSITSPSTSTTSPSTSITLPKPRQISSELKRDTFSRSRAMSLPVVSLVDLPQSNVIQIKKSSDFLKKMAAPTEKVPYFLRGSRGSTDDPRESNQGSSESGDVFPS